MNRQILKTFFALLMKDIAIYNHKVLYRSIDALVWSASTLLITQYILPLFGLQDPNYPTFMLLGNLAVWGLFEMQTSIGMFIGDLQSDRTISYYLTLPIPSYLVFIEQALASAYRSLTSSLIIFPVGKIILGNNFILSNIAWFKFIIAIITINIFYGFFTIFITSYVPDLAALTMLRSRIIFPLWFLGGFQFPWKMLHSVAPKLAYVNLCNPIIYVMDGIRSTMLPTDSYLPFWLCMIMLIVFSLIFGYFGIIHLKKRIDCL